MAFKFVTIIIILLLTCAFAIGQEDQMFTRTDTIDVPEPDMNKEGTGSMIVGEDIDADGKLEIYWVNDMWDQNSGAEVPRIYKMEQSDTGWTVVWKAELGDLLQNSWPALTIGDLDGDNIKELIWGPVNNFGGKTNPERIVVFEWDGSGDTFGIPSGDNYLPNTSFTITEEESKNIRPTRFYAHDVDYDGKQELIFNDRQASSTDSYVFGVASVDTIYNDGNGTSVWTLETSGRDLGITGGKNNYDLAVIDSMIFVFDTDKTTRLLYHKSDSTWSDTAYTSAGVTLGGASSFNSIQALDIDGNGVEEMIGISYFNSSLRSGQTAGIWLMEVYDVSTGEELLIDSITATQLKELPASDRGSGGAWADLDKDGGKDFVFGSRDTSPNGQIFRIEYTGAQDQVSQVANWQFSVIDSNFASGGIWNIIDIADIDDDANIEVIYTSSIGETQSEPLVVIEYDIPVVKGPYQLVELPYTYDGKLVDGISSPAGVIVDKYSRVWTAGFSSDLLVVMPNGTVADTIKDFDLGDDGIVTARSCRGIGVAANGNVLFARSSPSWIIEIDVDTHQAVKWYAHTGSPAGPAVDDLGFIYVAKVAGSTPVDIIDPATFTLSDTISLSPAASFTRGFEVSPDGLTLYGCDLSDVIHATYIYTSQDLGVSYQMTDSIWTDNEGENIWVTQTVTADKAPDGTIWFSHDNSYADKTNPDLHKDNALVKFDFDKNEYGNIWMPQEEGYLGTWGAGFTANMDTVYGASRNGTFVYRWIKDPSAIGDENGANTVPLQFELGQNYPNPFNPSTTIGFTVAKAGKTQLTIYNILGQKVITLVDQDLPRGKFHVNFDGSRYASGTYIYELRGVDGKRLTKKMVLVK